MFKVTRLVEKRVLLPISIILFTFSGLLMFIEALQRSLFSKSFEWSSEISIYCMIWSILLMIAYAGKKGHHIRIELLFSKMNRSLKRVLFILVNIMSFLFSVVLTYSSYLTVYHAYKTQQLSQTTLQLPIWMLSSILIITGILLSIYYLEALLLALRGNKVSQK
ncbi:TRAP transporter small permease [Virgibacillus litoralis]|uniref:TRAP-type C4-dicarboxylate transport system permease small subunit n=1 Tax=Virgibacillus litoralis TaxID=578221 RepID=A0ABS4H851_9BACI|nr:TRAP transporter small permease [Virgibacillus litoralis]MBP1947092.1 TRAP-type C4-dicarboxylate transport system permease small subunit [Virgibacillus litoralis]